MTRALLFALTVAYANEADLQRAFVNKPVTVRIDMPGTHEGINLHLDRDQPIDEPEYRKRIEEFGIALPKGRAATITAVNVKGDHIEFHLNGGGFGTYGDDTRTTVSTSIPKSSREINLERQLRRETDANRRRRLRSDLDREQRLRSREEARLRAASGPANAAKRDQVQTHRRNGGSRFNLRGISRANDVTPAQLTQWLTPYIEFDAASKPVAPPPPPAAKGPQIREGMTTAEVRQLLGDGKLLTEFTGSNNIRTQLWEFPYEGRGLQVTTRNGIVTSYTRTAPR